MRVLHVLNHSAPHTDGYCVRSADVVRFQARIGLEPVALTSPHQEPVPTQASETIDGVVYYRTPTVNSSRLPVVHELAAVRQLRLRLDEVVRQEHPAVIHAHSPCLWGYAASQVARRHRLPFVYEVRGLWEDAAVDQGRMRRSSLKYHLSRALETKVLHDADAVVGISRRLLGELTSRGVEAGKLFYVPNGVNLDVFENRQASAAHAQADPWDLHGRPVIAYIGSLYRWEGVDDLIRAMTIIVQQQPDAKCLIVGRGEMEQDLIRLVDELSLTESVYLLGAVPHDAVRQYYSVSDVLVYPRRKSRQTDMVTPLKPLEPMLLGKAVLAADVGGMRELLPEDACDWFEPGRPDDLAAHCLDLLAHPEQRAEMGARAQVYVRTERNWNDIVRTYLHVYRFAAAAEASIKANVVEASSPALAARY